MNAVKQELDAMASAGVIENSTSPYRSPMVIACRKKGCGDYGKVSSVTNFIAEPMSDHNIIIDRLAKSNYFADLDITKGYFQILLDPESKKITAFSMTWGLYHINVLPLGLVNSPAVFSWAMRDVMKNMDGVEVFVDDILVHTTTLPEHL